MTDKKNQQKQREEMKRKFEAEMKKNPEVSDEDFMAEFEASDDEYNLGITLPAPRGKD